MSDGVGLTIVAALAWIAYYLGGIQADMRFIRKFIEKKERP